MFGRAPSYAQCSNPAVLSEAAYFGSVDLGLLQLSMQRAVSGEGYEDAAP